MAVTPVATVLVPTHTHGETLRYAVASALNQTEPALEVLVIGDGVPDVTRRLVRDLMAADSRVRFFDFPKGESRGEVYRHRVLQQARGRIVCYLFDDDLWLPDHVETMAALLRQADFAFATPLIVDPDGRVLARWVDLASPAHRRLFTHPRSCTLSTPTAAAHTLAFYRRLPAGWRTTPPGLPPDKYMWAQCLAAPGCAAVSTARPTALVFPDPERRGWTAEARLQELALWSARLAGGSCPDAFRRRLQPVLERASGWPYRMYWRALDAALHVPGGHGTFRAASSAVCRLVGRGKHERP